MPETWRVSCLMLLDVGWVHVLLGRISSKSLFGYGFPEVNVGSAEDCKILRAQILALPFLTP